MYEDSITASNKIITDKVITEILDKMNDNKKVFSTLETIILVVISLIIGLCIGTLYNKKNIIVNTKQDDEYLEEFIKNYNYILNNYYKDIDKESLINNAIAGMMESLDDPYSVYLDGEESDNFTITLDGSYEGIGVQIGKDEDTGYMLITTVFKDSPAEKAGLLPGDEIISLDDTQAKDISASEFSSLIKKGKTSEFKLVILRDKEEKEITVKRDKVTLKSVASEVYEENNKKIGYIYIGIFANNTLDQFKEELEKLEKEKINYLIIDVRGNTGGHLTSVDSILDLFLSKNQIMYQFEQAGKKKAIYATWKEKKDYKIILLGDESSASASEVLIAGLRENLGSNFIGKKTYGKGTVQELITLSDGTQYKITIKKWLTPKGNWIDDTNGIEPDIEVELDKKYYTTYDTSDDTQLQKALEYIKNDN